MRVPGDKGEATPAERGDPEMELYDCLLQCRIGAYHPCSWGFDRSLAGMQCSGTPYRQLEGEGVVVVVVVVV
jgi:hypothetical protein